MGDYHADWNDLVKESNDAPLCGRDDWRVPDRKELLSILDYSILHENQFPSIDRSDFPNTADQFYWSSSTYSADESSAWMVEFKNGGYSNNPRSTITRVRLVSGGVPAYKTTEPAATPASGQTVLEYIVNQWPDSRYKGDGMVVTDTITGLMWKQCSEGLSGSGCATGTSTIFSWGEALEHAKLVNAVGGFAGYSDWRVPNIKELSSLVALDRRNPAINSAIFPNTPYTEADWFLCAELSEALIWGKFKQSLELLTGTTDSISKIYKRHSQKHQP